MKKPDTIIISSCYNFIQVSAATDCQDNFLKYLGLKKFRSVGSENPFKALVNYYCKGMRLLCLDEFQVPKGRDSFNNSFI